MDALSVLSKLPMDVIAAKAAQFGLDSMLVAAIIIKESSGMTCAMRYEPDFYQHYLSETKIRLEHLESIEYYADRLPSTRSTERRMRAVSYGPMQVMGQVAREHGFDGWFSELCSFDVGVEYGCRHLRKFMDKYGDVRSAVSAYNQGNDRKTAAGFFHNQKYVDDVDRIHREITGGNSL